MAAQANRHVPWPWWCAPAWAWLLLLTSTAAAQHTPGGATWSAQGLKTVLTDIHACGDNCISGRVQLTPNNTNTTSKNSNTTTSSSSSSLDVCDNPGRPTWADGEAAVACRELGAFTDASTGYGRYFISAGSVVAVECDGSETALGSCRMNYRKGPSPCVAVMVTCHGHVAAKSGKKMALSTISGVIAILCIVLGIFLVALLLYLRRQRQRAAAAAAQGGAAAAAAAVPSFTTAQSMKSPGSNPYMVATARPAYLEVFRQHSTSSNSSSAGGGGGASTPGSKSKKLRAPAEAS